MTAADTRERHGLFVDESGDHVFHDEVTLQQPSHRFLALLGCWFSSSPYSEFNSALVDLKRRHFSRNPDQIVLHREDIINCRGPFACLRDEVKRRDFDDDLLAIVERADFRFFVVVIDKLKQKRSYENVWHPYHTALNFLLQRYCGFLNNVARSRGDVTAESRGGREDRLLKESYERLYARGDRFHSSGWYQQGLTSKALKVKPKMANVAGLQLADILAHPVKQQVLVDEGMIPDPGPRFASRVVHAVQAKYNRNVQTGSIEGYGRVLYPK
jgi:hypothetical protein